MNFLITEDEKRSLVEDLPRVPQKMTTGSRSKLRRFFTWAAILLVFPPIAWTACIMGSIAFCSFRAADMEADAAVVLGAAVAYSRPTPVFEQRIRHAIQLYRDRKVGKLVLTGGVGYGDTLAESEVARNYCLQRGVPETDMLLEVRSRSTIQNLLEAKPLLEANGIRKVLLVSDPIHMRRALTLARDLGIDAYPSPTMTSRFISFSAKGRFLCQETYFYSRYLLLEQAKTRKLNHH